VTEKTEDDIKQELFEKLLEIWQPDVLLDFVRGEYKRGFEAGTAAAKSQEDLDRAYHRGRQSVLDDVRKMFPQHVSVPGYRKEPLAKSIVEVPSEPETDPPKAKLPEGTNVTDSVTGYNGTVDSQGIIRTDSPAKSEERTSEAPRADKPAPNVGGRPPKAHRPSSVPTNIIMARSALKELGRSAAPQIREYVRKKWWADVPKEWVSVLWGFAEDGRLVRDGINFALPAVPSVPAPVQKPDPQEVIDRAVAKRDAVAVKPAIPLARREVVTPGAKLGPPARGEGVAFQHGDKSVVLHQRERDIAIRLRTAMGVGHLDAKFLAGLIGIKSDAEATMRDFVAIMNPKLEAVGLKVTFYKGFGFAMAEI
jgi:hypothetical protein